MCLRPVIRRFGIGKKNCLARFWRAYKQHVSRVVLYKHKHATDFKIVNHNIGAHLSTMLHWTMKDFPTTRRAALVFCSITPSDNRISADIPKYNEEDYAKMSPNNNNNIITMTKTITHALHIIILYIYII